MEWTQNRRFFLALGLVSGVLIFADRQHVAGNSSSTKTPSAPTLDSLMAKNSEDHDHTVELVSTVLDLAALAAELPPSLRKEPDPEGLKHSHSLATSLIANDTTRIKQVIENIERSNSHPTTEKRAAIATLLEQLTYNEERVCALEPEVKSGLTEWYRKHLAEDLAYIDRSPEQRVQHAQQEMKELMNDLSRWQPKVKKQ